MGSAGDQLWRILNRSWEDRENFLRGSDHGDYERISCFEVAVMKKLKPMNSYTLKFQEVSPQKRPENLSVLLQEEGIMHWASLQVR